MRITEMVFTVGRTGSFRIPADVLRKMGIAPGEHVRVAYLSQDGEINKYQEFLLYGEADDFPEQERKIMIPSHLLEDANIPAGADLQIACLNGCLLIYQDMAANIDELYAILEQLQNANALLNNLSPDAQAAVAQLEEITNSLEKGVNLSDER